MSKLLMSKSDFTTSGFSEQVLKGGTHIEVTHEQMLFVDKNPKVNGPKLLHFVLTANGMPDLVKEAAWADVLRAEQGKIDTAAAPVAPAAPPVQVSTVDTSTPPTEPADDPFSAITAQLEGIKDKKDLVAYVTKTLGLVVDEKAKKADIIATAIADLRKASQEVV